MNPLLLYGIQTSYTKLVYDGERVNNDEDQVYKPLEDDEDLDDFHGFDMVQHLLGDTHRALVAGDGQENQNVVGGSI